MIEEQASVVDCEGDYVWVQTRRSSSCGRCSVKAGCGTRVLSSLVGNRFSQVKCLNNKQLKIGDQVIIGIDEKALLSGSFLIYLLPLLLMLAFGGMAAGLADLLFPELRDLLAVAGSAAGLMAGLGYAKKITHNAKARTQFQPVVLKKISSPAHIISPSLISVE